MHFGLNFFPAVGPAEQSPSEYYDEVLRLSVLAEELGFDHVQTVEHYFFPYGGYSPDPVVMLSAIAARTRRVRLMTGAVLPAFNHPVKLAAKLALLDNISHGRLDVGFGRAFLPDEFDAFQIPLDESRGRFNEGIEACKILWSQKNVTWDGTYHQFGPVTLFPPPCQNPHPPVFVASASSPGSCVAAGRAGHHLQVVPGVTSRAGVQEMLRSYRAEWAGSGPPHIQIKYTCYVHEDRSTALAMGQTGEDNYFRKMLTAVEAWSRTSSDQYPGYEKFVDTIKNFSFENYLEQGKVLAGTPEDIVDQISDAADAFGSDINLSLQFNAGTMPESDSTHAMHLFADDVMPKFAGLR